MLSRFSYSLPDKVAHDFADVLPSWYSQSLVASIWQKKAGLWTDSGEESWMGWLDIANREVGNIEAYEGFARELRDAGFEHYVLLGMGGSSLCPEVLAKTFGATNFHILDSTVPAEIISLEKKIEIEKTFFIVSSKSGSTLEPNVFLDYFYSQVTKAVGAENAGSHFAAITDPGSKLETKAGELGFRKIFFGDKEVGGRFSALSAFGLVPAAIIGVDLREYLDHAIATAESCKVVDPDDNAGACSGMAMGISQQNNRDKLTIVTSESTKYFSPWLEQLVAESTGKHGVSIIPIEGEPLRANHDYPLDRIFIFILKEGEELFDYYRSVLTAERHTWFTIRIADVTKISGEFFRWGFATAIAGMIMGINPFDQPDVEAAKVEARRLTDNFEETGSLGDDTPVFSSDGFGFYADKPFCEILELGEIANAEAVLKEHLARLVEFDYFAILSYLERNDENAEILQRIRMAVHERYRVATAVQFGPRFLHSTGQAYKGGAPNGVFLQITSDDAEDIDIPGAAYSFGVVKAAQSRGDFQVMIDRGRRALRIHMGADVKSGLEKLASIVERVCSAD
ncbi:MAG: hypothetical protein R2684_09305 [Pyrinomonadaceae bacterium]